MHNFFGLAAAAAYPAPNTRPNLERAARLIGFCQGMLAQTGVAPQVWLQEEYEALMQTVKTALTEPEYATCWQEGQTLTLEEAVALALTNLPVAEESS